MKQELIKITEHYPGSYAYQYRRKWQLIKHWAVCVPIKYGIKHPGAELEILGFRFVGKEWGCYRWEK